MNKTENTVFNMATNCFLIKFVYMGPIFRMGAEIIRDRPKRFTKKKKKIKKLTLILKLV